MKKSTARRAASAHTIPIGLQVAAKLLESECDWSDVRARLHAADDHARRLVRDPVTTLGDDAAGTAIATLAAVWGSDASIEQLAAAIPAAATHDPHAWITDVYTPFADAGLLLGLCLGWRLAGTLNGGRS